MFRFRRRRRWLLCGAVLVGVVALNGVVDAKAAPARGAVCVRVGAKALDGVSGRGLVCVQTKARGLRWRFAPTAVTTTTTSTSTSATTTSTSTSATTTVAVANVAPRVVSASAATGNAVITIADMSPDTGVYAVQWVLSGQDFNSYQMYRTTTKTMTVPYLSCTRTYTLRVFVMQENWQMTDGFVNQNVTPHSATFDLTMPACTATAAVATTTTVALTCATGAACVVGDTGPGGGIVFYVASLNFTSTGSDCGTTCKYLEAAPTDESTGIAWCSNTTSALGTTATDIGTGMANTTTADGTCTSGAIQIAADYTNNGKIDWHLPSKDELNQMCKWQRGVALTPEATRCALGTLNSGAGAAGFASSRYMSSSENSATKSCDQDFGSGTQYCLSKEHSRFVRPVRAFG